MPGFLGRHAPGEHLRDLLVTRSLPHQFTHVPFFVGKEAVSQLSFGRHPESVAVRTEGLTDGVDKPDSADPVGKCEIDRRLTAVGSFGRLQ